MGLPLFLFKDIMTTLERLENKIERIPECGCWIWTGGTCKGYGLIKVNKKSKRVHRESWEQSYGEIPHGMLVCHRCDTPSCINPNHLFLGTVSDNAKDAVIKKRLPVCNKGSRHPATKLNEIQVNEIRNSKGNQRILGEKFGVTQATISLIRLGKSRL